MTIDVLTSTAWEIVDQLARGDCESVIGRCAKSRLTCDDLRTVIYQYGRKLISPPAGVYDELDLVKVKGAALPTWSVRVPLWTQEEGRSDMTLELTIEVRDGVPIVELVDLRVP
jgi:hypothetical protein